MNLDMNPSETAMISLEKREEQTREDTEHIFEVLKNISIAIINNTATLGGKNAAFSMPASPVYSPVSYRMALSHLKEFLSENHVEVKTVVSMPDAVNTNVFTDFIRTEVGLILSW